MVMLLKQTEKFHVQRYKRVAALRKWCWVTIGYFNAMDATEARKLGRDALADKISILRARRVGDE